MQFATRQQIQQIHKLGSDRNALAVLKDMKNLLHVKPIGRLNVYYLNEQGRAAIGAEKEVKWNSHVEHTLTRNDVYVRYDCPRDWHNEYAIKIKGPEQDLHLVSDAFFISGGIYHFLEVDRTQNMRENKQKLHNYSVAVPAIANKIGHSPVVLFYTTTQQRKERLKALADAAKIAAIVITKEDLQ